MATLKCTMILGDCLEVIPALPRKSVQMCFADLPYGVTAQTWDSRVPLDCLWPRLKECVLPSAVMLFTSVHPFSNVLINSNAKDFRYDLVWNKNRSSNFFQARHRPMRTHENVMVFWEKNKPTYNPQMFEGKNCAGRIARRKVSASHYGIEHQKGTRKGRTDNLRYPISIIFAPHTLSSKAIHPTQKPVALLDWLIRTYSNPGDTVLNPVSGSFTTSVAACLSGRSSVGIEKDLAYFEAGVERVRKTVADNNLDVAIEVRR